MDAMISRNGMKEELPHSEGREADSDNHVKKLLVDLIDSSKGLDVRVWLDGVYTDIADKQIRGEWMNDRDVYFKVEGSVPRQSHSECNVSEADADVARGGSGA